jgi:hypothetical protein
LEPGDCFAGCFNFTSQFKAEDGLFGPAQAKHQACQEAKPRRDEGEPTSITVASGDRGCVNFDQYFIILWGGLCHLCKV